MKANKKPASTAGFLILCWLPCQGSNLDFSDPESDVLPITPQGKAGAKLTNKNEFAKCCQSFPEMLILADVLGHLPMEANFISDNGMGINWKRKVIFFLLFLLAGFMQNELNAQSFRLERPRIRNFPSSVYGADKQNWSISQDGKGRMYFANNKGLVEFNGSVWKTFPFPAGTIVRSVLCDSTGRIYAGSFEEFGYWEKTNDGKMKYISLVPQLKNYQFHNEEIWNIVSWKGIVYFQSFSVIFAWDGTTVEPVFPPGFITCFTGINSQLLLVIADHGLFQLSGRNIAPVDTSDFFRNTEIRVLLSYDRNNILVATANKGIYLYESSGKLVPWFQKQWSLIGNAVINRGAVTRDSVFILGTILEGAYAFTREGNLLFHITRENGIQNNTVLSAFTDQDNNVWLGLDNGIDLVILSGPVSFSFDPSGKLGSVYAIAIHEGYLYAGTNQGIFCSPFNVSGDILQPVFRLIPGSQGQVWSFHASNSQLLCGHNEGTFEVYPDRIVKISPVTGGFSFTNFRSGADNYLIQSTYTDLVVYAEKNQKWIFRNTVSGFRHPIRQIMTDQNGNIWACHLQRGLFKVKLSPDLATAEKVLFYGKQKGLESDYGIRMALFENHLVFLNEGRVYSYNDLLDSMVLFDFIHQQLKPDYRTRQILTAGEHTYFFVTDNSIDLFKVQKGNLIATGSYPTELFDNKLVRNFEFVYPCGSDTWMTGLENGLALFADRKDEMVKGKKTASIEMAESFGRKDSAQHPLTNGTGEPVMIPFSQNSIVFHFSCPMYTSEPYFLINLDGMDKEWISTELPYVRYERLPWGKYVFHVKAVTSGGEFSDESIFTFIVRRPWYWSTLSKIIYGLILLTFVYLSRIYVKRRLENQARKLRIEKEREMIRLRNEKLEAEVHYKSLQLANTTYSIIKKNELLMELKRLLGQMKKPAEQGFSTQFRNVLRLLDRNITDEEDWKVFESNFEQAHEEFLKRIKRQYPDLTPGDLKLCAFIRMNLSSKKIAALLGITTRGVENHRYRLRKKLNLDRDVNLTDYLMQF